MQRYLVICLIIVLSIFTIGCSQNNQDKYSSEDFIGTWKANSSIINEDQDLLKDNIITLKANGDVVQIINGNKRNGNINNLDITGNIEIKFEGSNEIANFSYDSLSNTLNQSLSNGNIIIFESYSN